MAPASASTKGPSDQAVTDTTAVMLHAPASPRPAQPPGRRASQTAAATNSSTMLMAETQVAATHGSSPAFVARATSAGYPGGHAESGTGTDMAVVGANGRLKDPVSNACCAAAT